MAGEIEEADDFTGTIYAALIRVDSVCSAVPPASSATASSTPASSPATHGTASSLHVRFAQALLATICR